MPGGGCDCRAVDKGHGDDLTDGPPRCEATP